MKYLLILGLLIGNSAYGKPVDFEKRYYSIIKSIMWAADMAEVPRELVLAVCWSESSFRTNGVTHMDGHTTSHGICQVKLETALFMDKYFNHKVKATVERLESTRINAFYAAKYLRYQLDRYDQNWKLAVDAYNKGRAVSSKSKYVKQFIKSKEHIKKQVPSVNNEGDACLASS